MGLHENNRAIYKARLFLPCQRMPALVKKANVTVTIK